MQWWIATIIICTLMVWQIALAVWLIMRYHMKNQPPMRTPMNVEGSMQQIAQQAPSIQSVGVVDVHAEKKIFVDSVDEVSVKLDEEKTGKVKTQKNKLRGLIK